MSSINTTILDTRYFRCAAYDWEIFIYREVEPPAEDPIFANPAEAWEYFKRIKRSILLWNGFASGVSPNRAKISVLGIDIADTATPGAQTKWVESEVQVTVAPIVTDSTVKACGSVFHPHL